MAVTANFSAGTLTVFGDALNNTTTITRNAAGTILVNGGAVAITGGPATVANTTLIQAFGQSGDDIVTIDESNGAMPLANLFGGPGNDALTGGSGADQLFGQSGNDTLLGKAGVDFLFGGTENDVLTGGAGDDQMFGEAGDDRMVWNAGDGTDLMEGGNDIDTAEVNGGNGGETFAITANGTRVRFDRTDAAPFALDIGTTENLVLNANGGNDTISAVGNLSALIKLTIDGGAGNDTILGGNGADTLLGGDGNDFIDGNQGNDTALMGAGDDMFQWDPGDGSDTVDGQAGADMILFNGSATGETFDISASGDRVRLTRNVGNIVMDLKSVENIFLRTLGASDNVVVNDLSGTGVTQVNLDLAGTIGGNAGDAAADNVTVMGRQTGDTIQVSGSGTSVSVAGLPAVVRMTAVEGANDALVIHGLGGDDLITAAGLGAGVVKLTIDGDGGNDAIFGSHGSDTLLGGDGNDFVSGGGGNDVAQLGAGNDVFQWNPGDGNDTIEGGDGVDKMLFVGANSAENVDIFANGDHVRFTRDVATVTMDLDGVEQIDFRALGGADRIVVGDLSGTDVTQVNIDLRGPTGTPDGAVDSVTANATQGGDTFVVAGNAGGVTVSGVPATTKLTGMDATDQLTLNGQGGSDMIDARGLAAGALKLTINGGLGNDALLGSQGDDLINGGDGNDVALMGAGNDTFVWNPGDDNDVIEGQAGTDTMLFNGAVIAETINIFANGGRASFTRDVAAVAMDMNDVETITFTARGGADTINVGDMSGTDVARVNIDLAGAPGTPGGDGAADKIVINGTGGNDVITVSLNSNGALVINGLASQVVIENFDFNDTITINGLGGNDVITAAGFNLGGARLVFDGGAGDDVLTGSAGNDTLIGGPGHNVMVGGGGVDDIYDEVIIIHGSLVANATFHEMLV